MLIDYTYIQTHRRTHAYKQDMYESEIVETC